MGKFYKAAAKLLGWTTIPIGVSHACPTCGKPVLTAAPGSMLCAACVAPLETINPVDGTVANATVSAQFYAALSLKPEYVEYVITGTPVKDWFRNEMAQKKMPEPEPAPKPRPDPRHGNRWGGLELV